MITCFVPIGTADVQLEGSCAVAGPVVSHNILKVLRSHDHML